WTWPDTLATALVGVPLGLAFWLLPGPPSLLGVSLAHIAATCGFLGPGPYLLQKMRLVYLIDLDRRQRVTLIWAGLAVVLAGFDGSILILALPAIAREFHANTPALSALGSILAIGTLGALPLATLADRFGRRRLIAVGVAGFSLVNFASAFVGSLAGLAFLRLFAVCFEVLVVGVSTALIVEEAPQRSRVQAVSVLALLSGFG